MNHMPEIHTREKGPEAVATVQRRPLNLSVCMHWVDCSVLSEADQHTEIFKAAWKNANASIGKLHTALEARRLALEYAEAEKTRLVAAVALWRRRYKRSWKAVAAISAYAGAATLGLIWSVLR